MASCQTESQNDLIGAITSLVISVEPRAAITAIRRTATQKICIII